LIESGFKLTESNNNNSSSSSSKKVEKAEVGRPQAKKNKKKIKNEKNVEK